MPQRILGYQSKENDVTWSKVKIQGEVSGEGATKNPQPRSSTRELSQGFPTKLLDEEKRIFHEGYFGNFLGICKYINRIESDRNLSLKLVGT